ncbi:tyrosine-protein phosphatase [Flavobacterium psychrotolerans]|uniref:protein-tyrosine-phosphatase n=1 Tax=Flavobacterium psychrotolerans TaxID=2169410 RepID=A0A2U1JGN5_9FLAO|nr:CpsB/CapC family capsule biosynthesis tyrosine phosphatase [Flavobacterium psychrotolerans]PWA04033.1 histidinol phosphatase [Flavobacterium psychrotolerans]
MLTLFRPKTILKDLIPENYIDIHSHLLPGIDDGAQTIEDTLSLVTAVKKLGFEQCITTPHIMKNVWDNTRVNIETTLSATAKDLKVKNNGIPMKAAAEYLLDANFVTLFQNEPLLVLKDNYVLVEVSYINAPLQLYDILFELQVAGYKPIMAHPERYSFYHHNFEEYLKLKHSGCLFQINLLSTIGYYGNEVAKTAEKLLKKGMIDFVGSDVHHQNHVNGFSKRILIKDTLPLKEAIEQNQFFRF